MDREEIRQQAEEYRQPYRDRGYHLSSMDIKEAFEEGAEWMQKKMIDKACEYAEARYDLDYCGDVKDILNYLKSLVEE